MAALTAEPAQLDRLTVLRSGGETAAGLDTLFKKDKGKESIKVAKELRTVQPAGGKEAIRAGLAVKEGETKFNVRKTTGFKERFGAGKKGATTSTPEEMASYKKAEQSLRENSTIALFLELKSLSPIEQTTMLADPAVTAELGVGNNFTAIKKEALRLIVRSDSIKAHFPELDTNGLNESQKMSFIESTLFPADDARFAARFGTRLRDAYKKAIDLPLVGTDEERSEIEKQIKLQEQTISVKRKSIADVLKTKGIQKSGGGDFTPADIEGIITTGGTADVSGEKLIQQVYLQSTPAVTLADYDSMRTYADLPKQITESADRIRTKLTATVTTIAAYKTAHPSDPDVMEHTARESKRLGYLIHYGPAGVKRTQYENFSKNFLPLLEQNSLTGLASEVRQAQIKLEDVKIKKSVLPPTTADVEKSRDLRILQEEDLLGEIDGILGRSIADVLEERYDVMEERMGRLSEQQEKEKDQEVKQNILALKKKMSRNWIKYDGTTRKKTIDKKQIKNDVTHLAYHFDKDVALKQLIARDLFGMTNNYQSLNLIDGKDGTGNVVLDARKLEIIEKVFESNGTEYRDKLFADMFAARGFMDRSFNILGLEKTWGELGFKRDEWKYMMQRYEPDITKALQTNQDASQALKSLEAQGVKVEASTKWLLYLIAIVFGGLTGGLGGAAIPGIGAAVGATAGIGAEVAATKAFTGRNRVDVNGNDNTMA